MVLLEEKGPEERRVPGAQGRPSVSKSMWSVPWVLPAGPGRAAAENQASGRGH